jgi:hypothetical protein
MILQPSTLRLSPLAFLSDLAQRAGDLLRTTSTPYHLSTSCGGPPPPPPPTPAPCTCPSGLASIYTVNGFGALAGCSQCDASLDPGWPGTIYQSGAACLWWALDPGFDPFSVNGKTLDLSYTQLLLRTTVSPCRWELYIACTSTLNPTKTMWAGWKTTGSTPVGTYTFVSSDCGNTTATMTVS